MAIPQDIYEAAEVDGASGWRKLIHVTFPLIANVYLVSTLLFTIWTYKIVQCVIANVLQQIGTLDDVNDEPYLSLENCAALRTRV